MKFLAASGLLAAFSFASALADSDPSPTDSYPSLVTPTSVVTDSPVLELRQNQLVDPNAALTAITGAGAVTNYNINSQIGPSVGTQVAVVFTQTFANVPDQWPSAKAGTIGFGDLQKRNLDAAPTLVEEARVVQTGYTMQPVVLQMVTEVVTVPVHQATTVVVVETVTLSNSTGSWRNGTALGSNGTAVASAGFGSYRPLFTATAHA